MEKRAGWEDTQDFNGYLKECVSQSEDNLSSEVSTLEEAQKDDGGTVVTVMESIEDSASDCASASTPASSAEVSSKSSCESATWSVVVNGTRFFGHLQSGRGSISELEDKDNAVSPSTRGTTKERNRR